MFTYCAWCPLLHPVTICCSSYLIFTITGIIYYGSYCLSLHFVTFWCTHTHNHACAAQSMGMILINSESSLVRGLPYTSHLSSLLESGSTLIVWKWDCINDVNPWKISSGCGGAEKQGGAMKKRWRDKTQTDRKIAWWTERQPQGLTFSLHEFPHVSISHLFFCLLWLSSPQHTFTCQHDGQ